MDNNKRVYLDYAATTPVDPKVLRAMLPYFSEKFGNPMSLHAFGQEAKQAVDKARKTVADFLHCESDEIIFTSGATESNNLAIKGVMKRYYFQQKNSRDQRCVLRKPHIITTPFEHPCVRNSIQFLAESGQAEVSYLPVSKEGIVKKEDVRKALRPDTILVSIMYVNNEIGSLQPIAEIGKMLKKISPKTLLHTDATQAINYFDCNTEKLKVDLLSFSGHKIYGPKGVGVLYIRKNSALSRIQDGGEQENRLRAGTHNVSGIVGLAEAIQQVKNPKSKVQSMAKLRDYLIQKVLREIPEVKLNGARKKSSPAIINFIFRSVEGESLLLMLDREGIACSTGSACSSESLQPSHVLLALGIRPEDAHGSLRLSLGKYTTKREIEYTVKKIKEVVKNLRKISGGVLDEFNK